jgi:sortase A
MERNYLVVTPLLGIFRRASPWRALELLCWGLGLALLGYAALLKLHEANASEAGLQAFALAAAGTHAAPASDTAPVSSPASTANSTPASGSAPANTGAFDLGELQGVDQSLWSKKRIAQFAEINKTNKDLPLAILRIDALNILVPIYSDASDFNLNRGAGWIEDTASVDERGNIGIAAHRDSFFRALKDAKKGQKVSLQTLQGTRHFTLANIQVIDPSDVSVLEATSDTRLTLVTCYPFYHVGSAPQRYIVTATEDISAPKPKE